MTAIAAPPSAPPMFVAFALDDPLFGGQGFGLVGGWRAAGRPVEVHAYQKGGHGFGVGAPGTTSTDWIDSFLHRLMMNGLTKSRS